MDEDAAVMESFGNEFDDVVGLMQQVLCGCGNVVDGDALVLETSRCFKVVWDTGLASLRMNGARLFVHRLEFRVHACTYERLCMKYATLRFANDGRKREAACDDLNPWLVTMSFGWLID